MVRRASHAASWVRARTTLATSSVRSSAACREIDTASRTGFADSAPLRTASPVNSSLVPVTVGATGALVAGSAGHPLSVWSNSTPIIELADVVETSRDSGIWKVRNLTSITDGAMTSGSNVLTSASAPFTSAMAAVGAGYYVNVAGAGAAGASITALITGHTSATQVTIATNASTTVSGASVKIGQSPAPDGLHPTAWMAALMAASIDTNLLVL